MRYILSKKKEKTNCSWDMEDINKPEISLGHDPTAAKWGTVSAIAAFITALVSAGVLIYTVFQYIQISK
jgi:hypothetical protein